jgi:peptide/nickel transport system ATP-binding protein
MGSIPTLTQVSDRLVQIPGSMPRLNAIPQGCAFNPRCEKVFDRCRTERPEVLDRPGRRQVACWLYDAAEQGVRHG